MCVFVTLGSGKVFFRYPDVRPWISGGSDDIVRKEEIITGEVEWPNGRTVNVAIYAFARGLGIGEGTLAPVTILGTPIATHQDGSEEIWEIKTRDGKWKYGNTTVRTRIQDSIPEDSKETGYRWSASGTVTLTPYVWQETITRGGAIRFPLQVAGTFSTSGKWIKDSSDTTTQGAPNNSGTHSVTHKIYCSVCDAEGATAEAIGGVKAHEEIECKREGCGVEYRICDEDAAALHSICEGCSTWRCDRSTGKDHRQVTCPESTGCGKPYWVCSDSSWPHTTTVTGGCGHTYLACMSGDHAWEASCTSTDADGNTCNVGGHYECVPHTCTFNDSNPVSITYNKVSFEVYETLEVTVTKKDLYAASLYIDGEFVDSGTTYSGKVVLRKRFNSGDVGTPTITITVWYNGGSESTSESSPVSVE